MAKKIRERIIPSSGNAFADMGLPDAEDLYAKAKGIAAIETKSFFEERRKRADREAFRRILNREGGEPPQPEDKIE
jgi:hypothetical protein